MELWIRDQDKTFLMKVDNVNLGIDMNTNEPSRLFTFIGGATTSFTLGIYKSKERALEVLNEIKERILNLQLIELEEKGKARKDVRMLAYLECVYQMPEK